MTPEERLKEIAWILDYCGGCAETEYEHGPHHVGRDVFVEVSWISHIGTQDIIDLWRLTRPEREAKGES